MNYSEKFKSSINKLKFEGRYRHFNEIERHAGQHPNASWKVDAKTYNITVWCSNDYLGMSQNNLIINSMVDAVKSMGTGSGGTRNISGNSSAIVKLEKELSILHNKKKSIVFSSGYVANESSISTLLNILEDVVVFSDEKNHASIINGIKKSKAKTVVSLDSQKEKIDNQKPEAIPLPDKTDKKIEKKKETRQNPEKVDNEVKQVSEFEKKDLFDPSNIAALIDKSKIEEIDNIKKNNDITQDQDRNIESNKLTLSEEDALKAQIFGCWSIPLGLPYNEDLLVRIKLKLEPDGSVAKTEILDHARMNKPGQGFYKVLAESALRAVKLCQPLRVPNTGYERWKELQLNFDAREMLEG